MDADEERDAAESLIFFSQNPRENASHSTQEPTQERPPVASHREATAPRSTNPSSNPRRNRGQVLPPIITTFPADRHPARVQTRAVAAPNPPQRDTGPRRIQMTPANALQAYLIRQQIIAGIPPQHMIPMAGQVPYPVPQHHQQQGFVNNPNAPSVVQVSNRGVMVPPVQPASFNGVFHPPQMVQIPVRGPGGHAPGWVTTDGGEIHMGVAAPQPGSGAFPAGQAISFGAHHPSMGRGFAPGVMRHGSWDGSDENPHATQFPPGGEANVYIHEQMPFRPRGPPTGNMNQSQVQGYGQTHGPWDGSGGNTTTTQFLPGRSSNLYIHEQMPIRPRGQPFGNTGHSQVQRNGQTLHRQGAFASQRPSAPDSNHGVAPQVGDARPRRGTGQRTEAPHNGFDLLEALCRCLDVAQLVVDCLDVSDLVNLYAISRSCNDMFNKNYQRFTLRHARLNAPQSARVFPFLCYYWLFIPDKFALSFYHHDNQRMEVHPIPTFRWLAMVHHREAIVNEIVQMMKQEDLRLPKPCALAMKKLWFLMDIPDNRRREWTIRNRKLWQDVDLFFATFFLVQLDICLRRRHNRPNGALRRLVMAQPSLMFLWRVLTNTELTNQFDVVDAFVRWQYTPERREPGVYIFGVPSEQVGLLQYEGYYPREGAQLLQRPDELVVHEMVRRRLHMQTMYRDIFLLGNIGPYTTPGSKDAAWDVEICQAVREAGGHWLDWVVLEQYGRE